MSYGQHPGDGFCTLQSENKEWFYDFSKTENMTDKIALIVDKILADTEYFQEHPEIANLDDRRVFGNIPCVTECSIRFGIVYAKSKGLKLDLQKNPELEDLLYELNADNIDHFDVNMHHPNDRFNLSGTKRSGILMYTEDKSLKKLIRKAIKNIEKS
jgi:hypothetical protein